MKDCDKAPSCDGETTKTLPTYVTNNVWGSWKRLLSIKLIYEPATGKEYTEEVWADKLGKDVEVIRQERNREYEQSR